MGRFLGRLLLIVLVLATLVGGGVYLFGPHAKVAAAFDVYKAALIAGDARTVAAMTAEAELSYWEAMRRHALNAKREVVAALPFRQRLNVLSLRKNVLDGALGAEDLAVADARAGYATVLDLSPASVKRYAEIDLLFAVPTGPATSRGYFSLARLPGVGFQKVAMALGFGAYYVFEETPQGWLIDPTPMIEGSASENEYWATRQDQTGNTFIFNILGAADSDSQELLWMPLIAAP